MGQQCAAPDIVQQMQRMQQQTVSAIQLFAMQRFPGAPCQLDHSAVAPLEILSPLAPPAAARVIPLAHAGEPHIWRR